MSEIFQIESITYAVVCGQWGIFVPGSENVCSETNTRPVGFRPAFNKL